MSAKNWQSSRLWAFGDSYTYGQGLKDCYIPHYKKQPSQAGLNPSSLVYTNILRHNLKSEDYFNKSYPGASNRYILYRLQVADIQPGDLVVVGWSYLEREWIWVEKAKKYNDQNFGPWTQRAPGWSGYGYLDRDAIESYIRGLEYIVAGYSFVVAKGAVPLFFNVDLDLFNQLNAIETTNQPASRYIAKLKDYLTKILFFQDDWNIAYKESSEKGDWAEDASDPNIGIPHAGENTHKVLAKRMYDKLVNEESSNNFRLLI